MTTWVLDASAVLRYLDHEAGWEKVETLFAAHIESHCLVAISAIQWGEIAGRIRKRSGQFRQNETMKALETMELHIVDITAHRAQHAAAIKVDYKIPYAEAFAVELALDSPEHILVTADYDFKQVEKEIRIEFLPAKASD